ncbi:MAG: DUF58 domain-containing protein [Bdellovibrionales bacterium]|nr:DUF58 domain-containing protein [Bdellovibrionales bacterium]
MSLPPEILKKVKLLEIKTRKLVNNLFAGEYHSAFRGQGMTFSEFREYIPGDDVRAIAWSLTARAGKPYIKKYDEERELTLMLVVDVSGSEDFGSKNYFKGEIIAHLAAVLSFSALKNKDPVGLLLFSDQVEHFVPPRKGRGHIHRLLRDLYFFKPRSQKTKIAVPLDFIQGILKKRTNIFLFSDFMDKGFDQALRRIGKKHDTVAIVVTDPTEMQLPNVGLIDFEDPESGDVMTLDTSSISVQRDYAKLMQKRKEERDRELRRAQVERVEILTDQDIVQPLISFFQRRNSK